MTGKPSGASERARKAFEASGNSMTVAQMCKKFSLNPSTIHRSPWYMEHKSKKKGAASETS